jgi:hypothetical protein
MLIGIAAIPPLGGYSGGAIQSLRGSGDLANLASMMLGLRGVVTIRSVRGGWNGIWMTMGRKVLKKRIPRITMIKTPAAASSSSVDKHKTPGGHCLGILATRGKDSFSAFLVRIGRQKCPI